MCAILIICAKLIIYSTTAKFSAQKSSHAPTIYLYQKLCARVYDNRYSITKPTAKGLYIERKNGVARKVVVK